MNRKTGFVFALALCVFFILGWLSTTEAQVSGYCQQGGQCKLSKLTTTGTSTLTGNISTAGTFTSTNTSASCATFDTNVLKVDCSANRVGINTTSPTRPLDVTGASAFSGDVALNGGATIGPGAAIAGGNNTSINLAGTAWIWNGSVGNPLLIADDDGLNVRNTANSAGGPVTALSFGSSAGSGCGLYQATGALLSLSGSSSACSAGVYMSASSGTGPLKIAINAANELQLTSTELAPDSSGGSSLGSASLKWLNGFFSGDVLSATFSSSSTATRGTITLSAGTGTATVTSGAFCVCTDTSAVPLVVRCSVSGTTLTATESSGTNVIVYICIQ